MCPRRDIQNLSIIVIIVKLRSALLKNGFEAELFEVIVFADTGEQMDASMYCIIVFCFAA